VITVNHRKHFPPIAPRDANLIPSAGTFTDEEAPVCCKVSVLEDANPSHGAQGGSQVSMKGKDFLSPGQAKHQIGWRNDQFSHSATFIFPY
jgi:hypothetical protein